MNRLYVHGTITNWPGVCEVNKDSTQYLYHATWPERSLWWIGFPTNDSIERLVRTREWMLFIPQVLQLPQGA